MNFYIFLILDPYKIYDLQIFSPISFHLISLCFILLTSAIIPALTFAFLLCLESDPKIISETAVKEVSTCFF